MIRFLAGVVVGALLGVAGTVAGAVAAGPQRPNVEILRERVATIMPRRVVEPAPVTVFVDRAGAHLEAGLDTRNAMASSVLLDRGIAEVDVPRFRGGDRKWSSFRRCLSSQFTPFAVDFVDTRPESGDFITLHVGGRPRLLGLSDKTGGIAPLNGDVIRNAHVFTFERPGVSSRDLCEIAAHEVGHALGLDHARACRDIMSYAVCGKKSFLDEAAKCGEFEPRTCLDGEEGQNSFRELLRNVGPRLREEPRLS